MNKIVNIRMLSVMAVVLTFLSLVAFVPAEAQAYSKPPVIGRLQRGVGNIHYTLNEGAERFPDQFHRSVDRWMYTGWDNPIYMSPVSSTAGSDMDFWVAYSGWWNDTYGIDGTSRIGETFCFGEGGEGGGRINPSESNPPSWLYAKIVMNLDFAATNYWEAGIQQAMGIGFGLGQSNDNASIMYYDLPDITVDKPQQGDNDVIIDIYGM